MNANTRIEKIVVEPKDNYTRALGMYRNEPSVPERVRITDSQGLFPVYTDAYGQDRLMI